jgi:hypothetical protein
VRIGEGRSAARCPYGLLLRTAVPFRANDGLLCREELRGCRPFFIGHSFKAENLDLFETQTKQNNQDERPVRKRASGEIPALSTSLVNRFFSMNKSVLLLTTILLRAYSSVADRDQYFCALFLVLAGCGKRGSHCLRGTFLDIGSP